MTREYRFWLKVNRSDPDSCWKWLAGVKSDGYGSFRGESGVTRGAHRVAYEYEYGEIPDGAYILHTCDTPLCVNPNHLYAGDAADNARDYWERGSPEGHVGEKNPNAKLSSDDVEEIRRRYSEGERQSVLADEFGVVRSTVGHVVTGESWGDE